MQIGLAGLPGYNRNLGFIKFSFNCQVTAKNKSHDKDLCQLTHKPHIVSVKLTVIKSSQSSLQNSLDIAQNSIWPVSSETIGF